MNDELFPGGRIPISHPGEALREDFLIPLGKDAAWLAEGLRMPLSELQEILDERRPITAETALRLNRFFGCSVEFWMGLQADYDVEHARDRLGEELAQIEEYRMPHLVYDENGQVVGTIWEQEAAEIAP